MSRLGAPGGSALSDVRQHDHRDYASHAHHHHGGGAGRFLGAVFWVAGAIPLAEVAGGLLSQSLALIRDAAHMFTGVLSLALAWYATRSGRRPPTRQRTYGYYRAGILAALFNAGTLIVVAGGILAESVSRFLHPVAVTPWIMWLVAAVGLSGDLFIGLRLGRAHDHGSHGNLNVWSAWLYLMGDAAASAGLLIALTGRLWRDSLVSVGISLLIARGAWRIIAQTLNVLTEGPPPGLDPAEVAAAMGAVWSLGGARAALSGRLVLRDVPLSQSDGVIARIGANLSQRFGIDRATLQAQTAPAPARRAAKVSAAWTLLDSEQR